MADLKISQLTALLGAAAADTDVGTVVDISSTTTKKITLSELVEYIVATQTARFGTYGRGIWDFDVKDIVSSTALDVSLVQVPKLYPNPATQFIGIQADITKLSGKIFITNAEGRVMPIENVSNHTVDIEALPSGIYFITFTYMGNTKTLRFSKV